MRRLVFLLAFTFISSVYAQHYLFEKHRSIRYNKVIFKTGFNNDSSYQAKAIFGYYLVSLTETKKSDSVEISIRYKNKVTFYKKTEGLQLPLTLNDTLYIADINGDHLPDFKIVAYNNGSGLAGSLVNKIYLFQKAWHRFTKLQFIDFSNFSEYDLNGDGQYEVIGQVLTRYSGHAYWTFNLFNYEGGKWKNVNRIANYPIMVQYLYRDNYKITDKLSRPAMKQFSLKEPDYFPSKRISTGN